jgi:hypothetical protein
MALKPLSGPQKRTLVALARVAVASDISKKIDGFEDFKDHVLKTDPEAAQAERFFKKAVNKECKAVLEGLEHNGS